MIDPKSKEFANWKEHFQVKITNAAAFTYGVVKEAEFVLKLITEIERRSTETDVS